MFWIKLGILVIGALYAVLLPYIVYKTIIGIKFDPREYTLSFLSNKSLYNKSTARGYTRLLLLTAALHYVFFWLLTEYYFLGEEERYLKYVDYSSIALTMLALVRHNMLPYSFKTLRAAIQRAGHNIVAVLVFLLIPGLIITFQILVLGDGRIFLGMGGLIIIGLTLVGLVHSVIKGGLNGITELVFINGLSLWSIFTAVVTLFG